LLAILSLGDECFVPPFYRLLAEKLHTAWGLSPDDLIISLVENTDTDWFFGRGRAQFLTAEL